MEQSKYVYVVFEDSESSGPDEGLIHAIFSTIDKAKAFTDAFPNGAKIIGYELDPKFTDWRAEGYALFFVSLSTKGRILDCDEMNPGMRGPRARCDMRIATTQRLVGWDKVPANMVIGMVWGKDRPDALNAADEFRRQMVEKGFLVPYEPPRISDQTRPETGLIGQ